ncbi:MAG: hypothetical protein ACTS3F_14475 [Phycisphaerales bacterium]
MDESAERLAQEPASGEPVRFEQGMDRKVIAIILALEAGSLTMAIALVLATGSALWVAGAVLAAGVLPVWLLWIARLRVRVDADRVRYSFFPFWRGGLEYSEIASVEVVRVDAMGQFGGWGPKWKLSGCGGFGLVARGGPAVRIERLSGRALYITMDDAEGLAAAILARTVEAGVGDAGMRAHVQVERGKVWWIWVFVLIGAGLMWWIFVVQILMGRPVGNNPGSDALVWALMVVIGIGMPVCALMLRVVIRVEGGRFGVRLWPLPGRSWALEEIVEGERVEWINGLRYGGYGVRWMPGKGWLVALRNGSGVVLRFRDGKPLRVVCGEPERLLEALGFGGDADPD